VDGVAGLAGLAAEARSRELIAAGPPPWRLRVAQVSWVLYDSGAMVRLVREPIDLASLQATLPRDGALSLFVGVVRDENSGRPVLHLEYEAYEEMALQVMAEIEAETKVLWPVTEVRLVHRLGRLQIGEASVAVAVGSPHRAEAFAACRYAIDTLKAKAPIWKKEFYADGQAWLEGPGQATSEVQAVKA
jgi:molybdopterin synthase catalytic subunit